ncbi:MAG: nucleotide disphospho-sugar-binding domain-containing protein, partial [Planctomycetota bacterium]|nr:nucleotide disphospho-sugar-binding domain-containing protein [Planctomycetota bacterium]
VPLSQLLPHAAALVHHGGIGTTSQALATGIPQLIMPMAFDQPDNADRVQRLGVGGGLSPAEFHPPRVAEKLDLWLSSAETTARCQAIARRVDASHAAGVVPIEATGNLLEQMPGLSP